MGKIVIKTTRKSNVSKVKVRVFEKLDAAKIALCAFVDIMSELNQKDRDDILYAAAFLIQGIADKANSERGEEQEDGNNSD